MLMTCCKDALGTPRRWQRYSITAFVNGPIGSLFASHKVPSDMPPCTLIVFRATMRQVAHNTASKCTPGD